MPRLLRDTLYYALTSEPHTNYGEDELRRPPQRRGRDERDSLCSCGEQRCLDEGQVSRGFSLVDSPHG